MRECDGAVIGWHEAGCSIRSRNDSRVELHEETLRNDAVHAHQLPHVALLTPENGQRHSFNCKRKMFTVFVCAYRQLQGKYKGIALCKTFAADS